MKKTKEPKLNLKLFTTFQLAHWENVVNITMAVNQSGYFTNIIKSSSSYLLSVYIRD